MQKKHIASLIGVLLVLSPLMANAQVVTGDQSNDTLSDAQRDALITQLTSEVEFLTQEIQNIQSAQDSQLSPADQSNLQQNLAQANCINTTAAQYESAGLGGDESLADAVLACPLN